MPVVNARARVEADFAGDGVSVWLGRKLENGFVTVEPTTLVMQVRDAVSAASVTVANEPAFRLPEDLARALLDALATHFGGVSEVQSLRRDYLAERARVDKMIDHLTKTPGGAHA